MEVMLTIRKIHMVAKRWNFYIRLTKIHLVTKRWTFTFNQINPLGGYKVELPHPVDKNPPMVEQSITEH
jgi:hypothetical protein